MKKYFLILMVFIVCTANTCRVGDTWDSISFKNNGVDTISVFYALNYPDTSLKYEYLNSINIVPYGVTKSWDNKNWAQTINNTTGKKLMLFVVPGAIDYKTDSIKWRLIMKNNQILKRYDLTSDDIIASGWVIHYP